MTLDEGSRVVVLTEKGGAGDALIRGLRERGVTVLELEPAPVTEQMAARLRDWLAAGPIQGIYWLAALDVEPPIEALTLAEWRELNRVRVKNLYAAMRVLYYAVGPVGTFLVAATRLGGLHGYGTVGASAPLQQVTFFSEKVTKTMPPFRHPAGALRYSQNGGAAEVASLRSAQTGCGSDPRFAPLLGGGRVAGPHPLS